MEIKCFFGFRRDGIAGGGRGLEFGGESGGALEDGVWGSHHGTIKIKIK